MSPNNFIVMDCPKNSRCLITSYGSAQVDHLFSHSGHRKLTRYKFDLCDIWQHVENFRRVIHCCQDISPLSAIPRSLQAFIYKIAFRKDVFKMPLSLQWLGQGGYLIKNGNTSVCIDPYFSDCVEKSSGKKRLVRPPFPAENLTADLVICTHDHLDHLDIDAVPLFSHGKQLFAGPDSCCRHFSQLGIDAERIHPFRRGDSMEVGGLTLYAVHAEHTKDSIGVIVSHPEAVLYFTADSLYSPKLLEVKKYCPDIVVTCINGKLGNMPVDTAAFLTGELSPKTGIPSHYGMFAENTEDPQKYTARLDGSPVKAMILEYGKEYPVSSLL